MKIILNLLSVPIKLILFTPVSLASIIAAIAGYHDTSDNIAGIIFEKWFK